MYLDRCINTKVREFPIVDVEYLSEGGSLSDTAGSDDEAGSGLAAFVLIKEECNECRVFGHIIAPQLNEKIR